MRKHLPVLFFFAFLALLTFTSCGVNTLPHPDSDSDQDYVSSAEIPVDDNIYELSGYIVGDINSYSYQVGEGYTSGYVYGANGYLVGGVSGSSSLWAEGKGFVRITLDYINPQSKLAKAGDTVIVKTSDQKVRALLPGDYVRFKCRAQYEAIAAVRENSTFDEDLAETWEFDYCRMSSVKISK